MKTRKPHRIDRSRQRGFLSSRQALVVLLLIFLIPTFVSLVMHRVGDDGWKPQGTTNRGMLVHPARPLQLPDAVMHGEQSLQDFLQGKWTLLYIDNAGCNEACRENLYKMRQSRIAQNEHMKRVQRLFIVSGGEPGPELAEYLQAEHPQMDTVALAADQFGQLDGFFRIDDTPVLDAGRVFIVDPLGNLMMYYQPDADAGGLLKDLRKLLKFSRIG